MIRFSPGYRPIFAKAADGCEFVRRCFLRFFSKPMKKDNTLVVNREEGANNPGGYL
jgi:hypothetical protein